MDCKRNITDLPIEILDILFECCGDMTNKLHLAQAHPYLAQAFAYHCRNLYNHISEDEKKSLCYWRLTLPGCGPNIKKIDRVIRENDHDEVELVNLIALHCSKLEKIKLTFETDSVACVKSLICQRQNSLRAINLRLTSESPEINTVMLHEFPELPLLEELKIVNIPIENYYHLKKFENLVKLNIGCDYPMFDCEGRIHIAIDILALCAPLKKLRILTLRDVTIISSEKNNVHMTVLPMEKLSLIRCVIVYELPVCFNLKTFIIKEKMSNAVVHRFILSQGSSLESLYHICDYYPGYNERFLEVIRVCHNLRSFRPPYYSVSFNLDFVKECVDILIENEVTPNNPLVLEVDRYFNYEDVLKWLKFTPCPEIIGLILINETDEDCLN
ncbi:uncharacterized protein [Drosophila kikkawai]|uniref:F-box domain-containing protein n=1 Tax=Drosophila kikkawai TaxID=30033 RepID=A0A6P4J8I9_DROKI|nr:uncharacterized protein LOC108080591 [Drosophila kikkawai]